MNEQERQLVVIAHALAHEENEIQYLKALVVEKTNMKNKYPRGKTTGY